MYHKAGQYLETHLGATTTNGEEYQLNCRNCSDNKKHFGVNIRLGVTNCFKCGYKPKLFWFFVEKCGLSYNEAKELMEYDTKSVYINKAVTNIELKLPDSFCSINDVEGGLKVLLDDWLLTNGIVLSDAEALGFGVATNKLEKYYGRLIIPVYEDGKLKTFLARALLNHIQPRYLFPPVSRGGLIWGIDSQEILKYDNEVIICEGWKDAYKVKGIALLGKHFHKEQIKKILSKIPIEFSLGVMLDKDAWKEGFKLADELNIESFESRQITLYYIYKLKDPGECKNRTEAIESSYKFDFSNISDRTKAKLMLKNQILL